MSGILTENVACIAQGTESKIGQLLATGPIKMDCGSAIRENQRLRAESLNVRADAIRTRIRAAEVVCSLVETQAIWGRAEIAQLGMRKVWRAIEEITRHIDEPGHVSSTAAEELRGLLATLEEKARNVSVRLGIDRDWLTLFPDK